MVKKTVKIRQLDHALWEIYYQDEEYRFRVTAETSFEELWEELEKIDRLSEAIT